LSLVCTLRLYLPLDESLGEPTYPEIFTTGDWSELGINPAQLNHAGVDRRARNDDYYSDKLWARYAAGKLHLAIKGNHSTPPEARAFAKLERVIMNGDGDQSWGDYEHDFTLPADALPWPSPVWDEYGYPNALSTKPMPHLLLNLESVKYYCQSSIGGPFALKADYLQPFHNPKIVTFHTRTQVVGPTIYRTPPLVIGSVNRYIFDCPRYVTTEGNGDVIDYQQIEKLLLPIQGLLMLRPDALFLYPDSYQFIPFEDEEQVPLGDTTIELYNYYRHIVPSDLRCDSDGQPIVGPSNLKGMQAHVDRVAGRWKGRVILKNLEDMVPCPACGIQEDYMIMHV
jgi:hypothetical protein